MHCLNETKSEYDTMIIPFLWLVVVSLFGVSAWIIWRAGKKAASLDFRLLQNDASLLEDKGVVVAQMTGLPPGARVVPGAYVFITPVQPTPVRTMNETEVSIWQK